MRKGKIRVYIGLCMSVVEGEEEGGGNITYYPFGPILKNSLIFFHFLLSPYITWLIFNTGLSKAYPRSYELTNVCKEPHQHSSTNKNKTERKKPRPTYIPSALCNVPINIMILPFHTRLSNTDTPHLPRTHDSHRQTKYDTQDINQYEWELGH